MPNAPKPRPVGTSGRYLSNVPDELWLAARQKALAEGTTVSAVCIRALEEYVR